MEKLQIQSYQAVKPMIYAYHTPGVTYHEGWTKIGYTEQDVDKRIKDQTWTAGLRPVKDWEERAQFRAGKKKYFKDYDFHAYLSRQKVEREEGHEWFHILGPDAYAHFKKFVNLEDEGKADSGVPYTLREEQERAVEMTLSYMRDHRVLEQDEHRPFRRWKFLWNAKPRFGKTLTAYDLIRRSGAVKALIVTNRPAVANAWYEDFQKFIGWQTDFHFISDNDALAERNVLTRDRYLEWADAHVDANTEKQIVFESLQNLKGARCFGGVYVKLGWIKDTVWDILIIDESHEGVDTLRTDEAFKNIRRRFTLHLSGTPFKALASGDFGADQIFNWSYADEQEAKENWKGDGRNPYEELPRLHLFTYQISPMIQDTLRKGLMLTSQGEPVDYAFDLNEFFKAEKGKLVHEEDVKRFLHALTTQEKYPFSTPALRDELKHTFWLLNRVDSARALYRLLENDPVFKDYHVVLAAADGSIDDEKETEKSYDRVLKAIDTYDKTITLSVGQLTTGVTIPRWSAVLMLSNIKSPALYMQAAFRAQNPSGFVDKDGKFYRKENAYVFDFDPARTLDIYEQFANNLLEDTAKGNGTAEARERHVKRLLNFFPVIGEDREGKMVELDAKAVLSIPRKLKSETVVKCGFMSNYLIANLANVFSAPSAVRDIIQKMEPAMEQTWKPNDKLLDDMDDVEVDEDGDAWVPPEIADEKTKELFGPKIYGELEDIVDALPPVITETRTAYEHPEKDERPEEVHRQTEDFAKTASRTIASKLTQQVTSGYDLKPKDAKRVQAEVEREIQKSVDRRQDEYDRQVRIAHIDWKQAQKQAKTEEDRKKAEAQYHAATTQAEENLKSSIQQDIKSYVEEKPRDLTGDMEQKKADQKKNDVESEIRDHIRGFARTIPSFIMAYGDRKLKLENFDTYVDDNVFQDVTSITMDEFRFLRDGGDRTNPETGEVEHYPGGLFDEVVFDDSVQNFLDKKEDLADYFDETKTEDIFDYIPPQKTNQIFTPKPIVVKMVDMLEEENPGIFSDPNKTFADLYMKSGLYITEIVKRLYRNPEIKKKFPDSKARLRHILTKQVYGFAPTRIIYLIAMHYIFGAVPELASVSHNFKEVDTVPYAKAGTLQKLVDKEFEK